MEQLIYPLSSLVSLLKICSALNGGFQFAIVFPYSQVAELGGTLGLFVGFSFLGFFDALVNIVCSAINVIMRGPDQEVRK